MSRKRTGPLRRPRTSRPPARIIRVHTEGRVTEPGYLEELARLHRKTIHIEFGRTGAVPATLASHACRDMDDNRRAQRRGDPLYDEIWCVFDRDEHPDVTQAISRAKQKGVNTAFSNPCFELWLVLHKRTQTRYIERQEVQKSARKLGLIKGKALNKDLFTDILNGYEDAKRRARELDQMHSGDGRSPGSNPSSSMWRLVDSIQRGSVQEDVT